MSTHKITNDNGNKFAVRIIRKGDSYGLNKCLTHDKPEPLVEFYDAEYAGQNGFDADGQFVSRYRMSTMLSHNASAGLDLLSYEPKWKIDSSAMREAKEFIKSKA